MDNESANFEQSQPSGTSTRGSWATRIGFILAASGSAIGLGNIWKFPYITGVYGGGAFVLVYLFCVVLVGLPLMISELMIGRRTQKSPVGAFRALHHNRSPWQLTGWLGIASGFLILSFYSIIAGWALAYIFKSIVGFSGSAEVIQGEFTNIVTDSRVTIFWHTIFMAMTIGIVMGGIQRGIERWSKVLMPLLGLILIGLMAHGLSTEGGSQALSFLFEPDFSQLSAEAVLSALGHAFFTLSLGMGAMITYGSYMKREASIIRDAITVSLLDTLIALLAGLAIFSMVFNYGLEPAAGPGLIFQTLPVLFAETGPWISVPFFVLLSFAALTSAISLLEVLVSYFIDEKKWSRMKATLSLGFLTYLTGLLSGIASLTLPFRGREQGFMDIFDFITTNYMLPIGGLLTCIFVAWVMPEHSKIDEFGSRGSLYKGLIITLKFITPVAVIIVILHGLELLPFMEY
jgi:NSS family neurotransmitter:Na+ symporter